MKVVIRPLVRERITNTIRFEQDRHTYELFCGTGQSWDEYTSQMGRPEKEELGMALGWSVEFFLRQDFVRQKTRRAVEKAYRAFLAKGNEGPTTRKWDVNRDKFDDPQSFLDFSKEEPNEG